MIRTPSVLKNPVVTELAVATTPSVGVHAMGDTICLKLGLPGTIRETLTLETPGSAANRSSSAG